MPTTERLRIALADRYSIEHEIGAGGMATVYLARDLKHDREVALKVLRADLSAVIGAERFLSEVRITARLDHPHILTLIDSGSADGILYYVLPYVRGESLRARLVREKQLGIDDALAVTRQVASALDYAHKQGVVHRDIKPENILFHEGEAVLADFGIALAVKEAGGNRLTETGLSLGTPQYMSPEQATGDRALDARSDIYSLAAVLYEMLAGEPPVTGATAQAVIAKLLTERPTSIRVVRDTVPPGVDTAVGRALAKVPADRFSSAGDFVRALDVAMVPQAAGVGRTNGIRYAIAGGIVLAGLVGGLALRVGRRASESVTLADRTQVTFNGRIRGPAISGDGKQVAYAVTNCRTTGCTYGIDVQDIGGTATRRLFDGASAMYELQWSQDGRNLLFNASINGSYGVYAISANGGTPRRLGPQNAAFFGNDSVLVVKSSFPSPDYLIRVSGLDGVPSDSIRIPAAGEELEGIDVVPHSNWIILRMRHGMESVWLAFDRSGRERSRMTSPRAKNMLASSDAIWMTLLAGTATAQHPPVCRVAFDAKSGRFGTRFDTVYRLASPTNSYSVTTDGGTLLFDEGIAEYDVWAGDLRDALRGVFPKERSILHSTSATRASISSDGTRVILGRTDGSTTGQTHWSTVPFAGGAEIPLSIGGTESNAYWTDSMTVGAAERTTGAFRFSLLDPRSGSRRAVFTPTDTSITDFEWVPGKGWGWVSGDGRALEIQASGTSSAFRTAKPSWYEQVFTMNASPDGTKLAFIGWSAPNQDSLGVSSLSLADGKETHLATVFGENGRMQWLDDGSLLFMFSASRDTYTLARIRGPGQMERLGTIPRPAESVNVSRDLQRMVLVSREQHGDAWTMRVVKR
jgi:hypothetical protein